ncbi:ankyrin repeat-containing protein [Acanthamoeba polyphaga mimivirus]|uniref:Ankyrin repeat-containing protein n=1 Tax=Acanthamoeba polyphaga mimivirus Kroon TaxID=3069720 RepID=A0A0G2Y6V4_9VIRU|nr:ankyrin repeat-containing protein [Acanthamoeba polyphaga mimivirus]AKI80319.1 ankyrin repeat-containing protein [Acanthamoeba polyphaga mimivirus Kroon]
MDYIYSRGYTIIAEYVDLLKSSENELTKKDIFKEVDITEHYIDNCRIGRLSMVKYLVNRGVNITIKNNIASRLCVENGFYKIFEYLDTFGTNSETDYESYTYLAAKYGRVKIIQYLIKNIDLCIHDYDDLIMRIAAQYGRLNLVKFSIKNGADITTYNNYALRLSSMGGHIKVVKYLIRKGADISVIDNTILRNISSKGHSKIISYYNSLGISEDNSSNDLLL